MYISFSDVHVGLCLLPQSTSLTAPTEATASRNQPPGVGDLPRHPAHLQQALVPDLRPGWGETALASSTFMTPKFRGRVEETTPG